jgi:hypothetical protein
LSHAETIDLAERLKAEGNTLFVKQVRTFPTRAYPGVPTSRVPNVDDRDRLSE